MSETKKCSGCESDKEKEKYPVEPIATTEPANAKDVKEALDELNPSEDSMDDNRG